MAKYNNRSEERIRSILKNRSKSLQLNEPGDLHNEVFTGDEISRILEELNVVQFELEMQNNELKTSYEILASERSKLANLYDYAPVGYFMLDHLGIIEEVNQTGLDLLGLSKASLQNKRFQSFLVPNELEKFYNFLHKMLETNKRISTEVKLLLPGKQFFYTRLEGTVIPNFMSSNINYYITVIDITESKNAQQLLEETKERLEMTLKASETGIWSIEFGSDKIVFDEYSYKILDLNPWSFNGTLKGFFSLIHPDDQSKVHYNYMYSLTNSVELDMEFRVLGKNNTVKVISTKGKKITGCEERNFFAGIIMDITEKVKLITEAENLRLEQQRAILSATMDAQESERMKISRALHDSVCQILYGIRLNLQSLPYYKSHRSEFENVNELLDQAIKETRQISYELTPSVLKDFGFSAGVKEMVNRLTTIDFSIKTSINKSIDEIDPTIQLYAFRMIQELLNNCIKHSNANKVTIVVGRQGDLISIIVSDNGTGFKVDLAQALRSGSGLRGIKNQVFLLNGDMNFKITKRGTSIKITFSKDIHL